MRLIPSEVRAGVPISIALSSTDVPAGWTAKLFLRGPRAIDVEGLAGADGATLAASAAITSDWPAGTYQYALRSYEPKEDGAVVALESGDLRILADISLLGDGHDARSHAQRVLEAIEATIGGRASHDQESYTIKGRTLARTPIADLLKLRDVYRAELARDRAARKGRKSLGRRVLVHLR